MPRNRRVTLTLLAVIATPGSLEAQAMTPAEPEDMLGLIGQYEYGPLKYRLYDIVDHLVGSDRLSGSMSPTYVHDLEDVGVLPPIMYPGKILNAAVNFHSHVDESGTEEERAAARRDRRENRGVPYLKPSRGAVVATGTRW